MATKFKNGIEVDKSISTTAVDIADSPLIVKAASGQTGRLQQWQNSSGTLLAGITSAGAFGTSNRLTVGSATVNASAMVHISATSDQTLATIRGVGASGSSTQTADLQQWQTFDGTTATTVTKVNNNGVLWINGGTSVTTDSRGDAALVIPRDRYIYFANATTVAAGPQRQLLGIYSTPGTVGGIAYSGNFVQIGPGATAVVNGIYLSPGSTNLSNYGLSGLGQGFPFVFNPVSFHNGYGTQVTETGALGTTEILASGIWTSTGWNAGASNTITAVSANGSAVTYTTTTNHGYVKDQTAVVTGFTPSGYNQTAQIIAVPAANQFVLINATTGTPSVYGSVNSYRYTRTAGAAALSNSTTVANATPYQVTYSITGTNTTDRVTISLGGQSTTIATINGTVTGIWGPRTTATTGLSVDTTTNWTGTITISVRQINASLPAFAIADSANNPALEIRTSSTALTGGSGSSRNTFIGRNSGRFSVQDGTIAGSTGSATRAAAMGYANIGLGDSALSVLTTGSQNVGVGVYSLQLNTTGSNNVSVGYGSILSNTTGNNNVAAGAFVLQANTTGSNHTAIGYAALNATTTANANTGLGYFAGFNTTGGSNTAVGSQALQGVSGQTNGNGNTTVGQQSTFLITSGANNTAIGLQSNYSVTTGVANTSLGHQAGYLITTGSNNTFVGKDAGNTGQTGTVSNSTAIGHQAVTTASNQIVIGNSSVTQTRLQGELVLGGGTSGAVTLPYLAITGATTLDATHYTIDCTSGGAYNVTLPTAVGITGRIYRIKNSQAASTITIATTSSQTIDGVTTKSLTTQYSLLVVQSTGSNWIVIN